MEVNQLMKNHYRFFSAQAGELTEDDLLYVCEPYYMYLH